MPIQPAISPSQIVTIVVFLLMLFALMWFVKRYRTGISSRLHSARRMTHVEDLALGPQQRLHLIEADGRAFLVHAGKGHAASFQPVDGGPALLGDVSEKAALSVPNSKAQSGGRSPVKPTGKLGDKLGGKHGGKSETVSASTPAKPKSAFAAAIAQARRNNPSLGFDK